MLQDLQPILFIPHGGGPLPVLGHPSHAELTAFLRSCSSYFESAQAIVVLSAHWEESQVMVQSKPFPDLYFDYQGFPEESYHLKYPAPGSPDLAGSILSLLGAAGISASLDARRDYDHGVFIPLLLMAEAANIPVLQVSLLKNLEARPHLDLGQALLPLRSQGILLLGSGLSFHNMQAFFQPRNPSVLAQSAAFDTWLTETCCSPEISAAERKERLALWTQAPSARFCHPREEHLLPLLVCAAAADLAPARRIYGGELMGAQVSAYLWN